MIHHLPKMCYFLLLLAFSPSIHSQDPIQFSGPAIPLLRRTPFILTTGERYRDLLTLEAARSVSSFAREFQPRRKHQIRQNKLVADRERGNASPVFHSRHQSTHPQTNHDIFDFTDSRFLNVPLELRQNKPLIEEPFDDVPTNDIENMNQGITPFVNHGSSPFKDDVYEHPSYDTYEPINQHEDISYQTIAHANPSYPDVPSNYQKAPQLSYEETPITPFNHQSSSYRITPPHLLPYHEDTPSPSYQSTSAPTFYPTTPKPTFYHSTPVPSNYESSPSPTVYLSTPSPTFFHSTPSPTNYYSTPSPTNYYSTPSPIIYHHSTPSPIIHHHSTPSPQIYHHSTPSPIIRHHSTPSPFIHHTTASPSFYHSSIKYNDSPSYTYEDSSPQSYPDVAPPDHNYLDSGAAPFSVFNTDSHFARYDRSLDQSQNRPTLVESSGSAVNSRSNIDSYFKTAAGSAERKVDYHVDISQGSAKSFSRNTMG